MLNYKLKSSGVIAKTFSSTSTSLFLPSPRHCSAWVKATRLRSASVQRRSSKNRRCYLQSLLHLALLVPARLISPGALLSCELLCRWTANCFHRTERSLAHCAPAPRGHLP